MTKQPTYDVSIKRVLERLRVQKSPDVQLVEDSACFARLWRDETGTCPNDGDRGPPCAVRRECEVAWVEANSSTLKSSARSHPRKTGRRRNVVPAGRKLWGEGKYERTGYINSGRPVDQALDQFLAALGNPPKLPPKWGRKTNFLEKWGHLGRITMVQQQSYTTIFGDGHPALRLWTNAAHCMLVDMPDELVLPIQRVRGVSPKDVWPIPDSLHKKLAPCIWRFSLSFSQGIPVHVLRALAVLLHERYKMTSVTNPVSNSNA